MKNIQITLILLIMSFSLTAQNLKKHRWEQRVVILFADSPESPELKSQLNEFNDQELELRERKIFLYMITPKQLQAKNYLENSTSNFVSHKHDGHLFRRLMGKKDSFQFVLIGLDGGEKLVSNEKVNIQTLFDLIDSMPMRKAELRNKYSVKQ